MTDRPRVKLECSTCGAKGVRLWRDYQTFLDNLRLYCVACALQAYPEYGYDPKRPHAIGGLVAARPTEDGTSFWGHSSGDEASVAAWDSLPLVSLSPEPKEGSQSENMSAACECSPDHPRGIHPNGGPCSYQSGSKPCPCREFTPKEGSR